MKILIFSLLVAGNIIAFFIFKDYSFYLQIILLFLCIVSIYTYNCLFVLCISAIASLFNLLLHHQTHQLVITGLNLFWAGFVTYYFIKERREYLGNIYAIESQETLYGEKLDLLTKLQAKHDQFVSYLSQFDKLSRLATIFTTFTDVEIILQNLVSEIYNLFPESNIFISVYDTETKRFKVYKSYPKNKTVIGLYTDNLDEWIYEFRHPYIIKNVLKEYKIRLNRYSNFSKCESVMASPIIIKNEVQYILKVENILPDRLTDSDLRILKYVTDMASVSIENALLYQETQKLAITDGVTGLYVQHYFFERLNNEIERANTFNTKFSLILLDIDDFKAYNDNYGHLIGDIVLIKLADTIKNTIRHIDFAARYGGDEFAIILPETDLDGGITVANRLKENIGHLNIEAVQKGGVKRFKPFTTSFGVGVYYKGETQEEYFKRVDTALYNAKHTGKNKIVIA